MKVQIVTFGSRPDWSPALKRIKSQAKRHPLISGISIYDQKNIRTLQTLKQHHNFINSNKRGFGYWIWKPAIMLDTIRHLEIGDFLIYLDAGCEINPKEKATQRLVDYLIESRDSEGLSFKLPYFEKDWTNPDVFKKFAGSEGNFQTLATVILLRKTENSQIILHEWLDALTENEYENVIDRLPTFQSHSSFQEHRHDQAIWSLLSKKWDFKAIEDETFFHPNWAEKGSDFPFWATRSRLRYSIASNGPFLIIYRILRKLVLLVTSNKVHI